MTLLNIAIFSLQDVITSSYEQPSLIITGTNLRTDGEKREFGEDHWTFVFALAGRTRAHLLKHSPLGLA
ncbi:unnamed protein product [Dicrocoelium dendriticum]|nr:unnamed protein product [Dicrocoelium dendriticum]